MDKDYLITIGLTTYNRIEMLKESVNSILNQSFKNFKLIIGNDYPNEPITFEKLEITKDSRINIVNHKNNIGEVNNMNFMLNMADTEWMMWFADDDLMHPEFLSTMMVNINTNKDQNISACYSTFAKGLKFDEQLQVRTKEEYVLGTVQFNHWTPIITY